MSISVKGTLHRGLYGASFADENIYEKIYISLYEFNRWSRPHLSNAELIECSKVGWNHMLIVHIMAYLGWA